METEVTQRRTSLNVAGTILGIAFNADDLDPIMACGGLVVLKDSYWKIVA